MTLSHTNNRAQNAVVEHAINVGIQRAHEMTAEEEIAVSLTEAQEKKVEEYCDVLGVSFRTMFNSAIKYVLFYAHKKGIEVTEIRGYPKKLGSRTFKLTLNAETSLKLKEACVNESQKIVEYVVTGINLLYERNLNIKTKG